MLKYLETLSNKWKTVIITICTILFLVSLCLLISALADDGINKFARVFYIMEEIPVKDDRWKEFLEYAKEKQIGHEHIEKLREIFGDTIIHTNEKLNTLGFSFFNLSMVLIMVLSATILSTTTYTTIKWTQNMMDRLRRENLISQTAYLDISNILNNEHKANIERINGTIDIEKVKEQIENETKESEYVEYQ
ncbi:hypothetical protein J7894_03035 [Mycoplasmopsis agalactiae]|nr:hypothetical protein [Mycoplasmopsis agalactiae]MCE6090683.1 hypothetical protein [Mycoplasmopsis agalactiae]MCE6090989.1 hypothetical protein [Mycoplasmopsis agalactiae]